MVIIMVIEDYWDGENWLEKIKNYKIIYKLNDKMHRKDGPAVIYYFDNGKIQSEIYYYNNKFHRNNGPALIEYYFNEKIQSERYLQNSKRHRTDGPASIEYYINGSIKLEEYYINGIEITSKDLPFELPLDTEEKELYFKLKYGKQ